MKTIDIIGKETLKAQVDAVLGEIIAIRRDLHAHPELSQQEVRTSAKISEYLTEWQIPHRTEVAGHGIVGLIGGKISRRSGGPVIAVRADMDALPIQEKNDVPYRSLNEGVMHACGHDIHTAVLLGATKILKGMEDELPGTVKLLFQPAEETVGGALPMIRAGCLKDPDVNAVIGLHVDPDIPAGHLEFCRGSMNAASNEFTITVTGVSCHGAHPHNGVDAILAASQVVNALQSVAARSVAATDAAVVTVGLFQAGTAPNVLAGKAVLKGIVRTLDPATRSLAVRRVAEIAEATAAAYGAAAQVDFTESYPALINDDQVETILEGAAASFFDREQIHFQPQPSMGAEDFSYFCSAVKGAYFNIGTRSLPEGPSAPLHSEYYCPDERCISAGILMEIAGVLALMEKLD